MKYLTVISQKVNDRKGMTVSCVGYYYWNVYNHELVFY